MAATPLEEPPGGRVQDALQRPGTDGTTSIVNEPFEPLEGLVALAPPPSSPTPVDHEHVSLAERRPVRYGATAGGPLGRGHAIGWSTTVADTPRVDASKLSGFARLAPEVQQEVRRLLADPRAGSTSDAHAWIEAARQTDAGQDPSVKAAISFLRGHERELAAGLQAGEHGVRVGGPAPGAVSGIDAQLHRMTLREKAALVVMEYGNTSAPPKSGGMLVNRTHLTADGLPGIAAATARFAESRGLPLLVAADQEGGIVNQMRNMPSYAGVHFPSPREMAGMTLDEVRAEGRKTGSALKAAGINLLLGPVLDVADPGTLMHRTGRSFGSTPEAVTSKAAAFIEGLRDSHAALALVGKHFPGYNGTENTDFAPVSDTASREAIAHRAEPFFALPELDGIMINSVRYPAIDDRPACFSPGIISMIRAEKPDTVVVTDDLFGEALLSESARAYKRYLRRKRHADTSEKARHDVEELLADYPALRTADGRRRMAAQIDEELTAIGRQAFEAGADILLILDIRAARLLRDTVERMAMESPANARRLDQSVRRILLMRQKMAARAASVS